MKYFRTFVAGLVVPSIILPFGMATLSLLGKQQALSHSFLYFMPIIWGIWNLLYFLLFKWLFLVIPVNPRLYLVGGLLGLLVAFLAVFTFDLPEEMGLPHYLKYAPLIAAPIIYAFVWRYIVKWLNEMLELKN